MATIDNKQEDIKRLQEMLKSSHCPDCGRNDWQDTPINPSMKITCLCCGALWMLDLNREAWV